MAKFELVTLPGSTRVPWPENDIAEPVPPDEPVGFTVYLRRRCEPPEIPAPELVSEEELAERYGADPADVALVVATLESAGAQVVEQDPAWCRVRARATASVARDLFGAELFFTKVPADESRRLRVRGGSLSVPTAWDGIVTAVLGLDNRPQVRRIPLQDSGSDATISYTPVQLAKIYGFPAADGAGVTVAVLEFGGGITDDLDSYFAGLQLRPGPTVTPVSVDNLAPDLSDGKSVEEVMLDIEVLGAIVPKAHIKVYFSDFSDQHIADAIAAAAKDQPTPAAISISWGAPEPAWTDQGLSTINNALKNAADRKITVCVSSGDNGSPDGLADLANHVDFPSSSPYVLSVGGTKLDADPQTGKVRSETVWNEGDVLNYPGEKYRSIDFEASGGGVSSVFPLPSWQAHAAVPIPPGYAQPMRGVPDVAAVADNATGYQILIEGQTPVVGGTSASTPLWAGLICRYVQLLGTPLGLLQPLIYPDKDGVQDIPGFRGITESNNGAYAARPGWNACTGLGVPKGEELLTVLRTKLHNPK